MTEESKKAEKGNTVKVDYEGRFENGEVFDTSAAKGEMPARPLEFKVGEGMVVSGFDKAVEGMKIGEEKEVTLKPEEAYGERKNELQQAIPRDKLPQDQEPKEGMMLVIATPQGQQMPVKITKVDDKNITIDLNHPLAGKTLIFKIKLLEIRE